MKGEDPGGGGVPDRTAWPTPGKTQGIDQNKKKWQERNTIKKEGGRKRRRLARRG
jgi:hypothetical protein